MYGASSFFHGYFFPFSFCQCPDRFRQRQGNVQLSNSFILIPLFCNGRSGIRQLRIPLCTPFFIIRPPSFTQPDIFFLPWLPSDPLRKPGISLSHIVSVNSVDQRGSASYQTYLFGSSGHRSVKHIAPEHLIKDGKTGRMTTGYSLPWDLCTVIA